MKIGSATRMNTKIPVRPVLSPLKSFVSGFSSKTIVSVVLVVEVVFVGSSRASTELKH